MIYLAVICGLLVALQAWTMADRRKERQEVRAERADLLLRISETQQQTVLRHHVQEENHSPLAIHPDLDEDYWVSKEELADALAEDAS